MFSFKHLLLLLLSSVSSAAVIPQVNTVLPRANPVIRAIVPAGYCCFSLTDASTGQTIQQNTEYGFLYLGAGQPAGQYCFNSASPQPILWDVLNNACIIDWAGRFQCLDGTPGDDVWTLGKSSSSKLLLSHDSSPTYQACPNQGGGEMIYAGVPATNGCRNIQLQATGVKGTCSSYGA